jgi:hypothetical protein
MESGKGELKCSNVKVKGGDSLKLEETIEKLFTLVANQVGATANKTAVKEFFKNNEIGMFNTAAAGFLTDIKNLCTFR